MAGRTIQDITIPGHGASADGDGASVDGMIHGIGGHHGPGVPPGRGAGVLHGAGEVQAGDPVRHGVGVALTAPGAPEATVRSTPVPAGPEITVIPEVHVLQRTLPGETVLLQDRNGALPAIIVEATALPEIPPTVNPHPRPATTGDTQLGTTATDIPVMAQEMSIREL